MIGLITGLIPGSGFLKDAVLVVAVITCCAVAWKTMSKQCRTCCRVLSPRNVPCIARLLLHAGIDTFPAFSTTVTVHSIKDPRDTALLGRANLAVKLTCGYVTKATRTNKEGSWEQTFVVEVAQGTSTFDVLVLNQGKLKNSDVGKVSLRIKQDMLDERGNFKWGEKAYYQLTHKDDRAGQIRLSFRQGAIGDDASEASPLISGLDDGKAALKSAVEAKGAELGVAVTRMDGTAKVQMLAKTLSGQLTLIQGLGSSEKRVYGVIVHWVPGTFPEDDERLKLKALKNAKERGSKVPLKKWYFCWYEDKSKCDRFPGDPLMFIPIASISSVNRRPDSPHRVTIRYKHDATKVSEVTFQCRQPSADVWLDGLELVKRTVVNVAAQEKKWVGYYQKRPQSEGGPLPVHQISYMLQWLTHEQNGGGCDGDIANNLQRQLGVMQLWLRSNYRPNQWEAALLSRGRWELVFQRKGWTMEQVNVAIAWVDHYKRNRYSDMQIDQALGQMQPPDVDAIKTAQLPQESV